MATILYFKRIVLSSQQHAYPASRQISALRVAFYFYTSGYTYTSRLHTYIEHDCVSFGYNQS